jgi:hypothetical protein
VAHTFGILSTPSLRDKSFRMFRIKPAANPNQKHLNAVAVRGVEIYGVVSMPQTDHIAREADSARLSALKQEWKEEGRALLG